MTDLALNGARMCNRMLAAASSIESNTEFSAAFSSQSHGRRRNTLQCNDYTYCALQKQTSYTLRLYQDRLNKSQRERKREGKYTIVFSTIF